MPDSQLFTWPNEREELLASHPKLPRDGVPFTRPKAPRYGLVNAEDEYAALTTLVQSGHFRLRSPARQPEGLSGPFSITGCCLAPLITDDCVVWCDGDVAATDGDIVLAQCLDSDAESLERWKSNVRRPAFRAAYGNHITRNELKVLRCFGANWWLLYCLEDGRGRMKPVIDETGRRCYKILGVCRYVTRNGEPMYGCGRG